MLSFYQIVQGVLPEEAITTFRLMREATGIDIIKLEVIGMLKNTLSRCY